MELCSIIANYLSRVSAVATVGAAFARQLRRKPYTTVAVRNALRRQTALLCSTSKLLLLLPAKVEPECWGTSQ